MAGALLLGERRRVLAFRDVIGSGKECGAPAPMGRPGGLTVSIDGLLLVTDQTMGRLAVYDLYGGGWSILFVPGPGAGQLARPSDVTVDHVGHYLIADRGNRRLVRCAPDGSEWATLGGPGQAVQFADPMSVAVDDLGRVLVADPGVGRVIRFDNFDGANRVEVALPPPADPATPPIPLGVAALPGGWALADAGARTVTLFDLDDNPVASTGPESLLVLPAFVAGDGDAVIVGDPAANEVQRFHVDNGTLVSELRIRGSDPSLPAPVFDQLGGVAAGKA